MSCHAENIIIIIIANKYELHQVGNFLHLSIKAFPLIHLPGNASPIRLSPYRLQHPYQKLVEEIWRKKETCSGPNCTSKVEGRYHALVCGLQGSQ